ncbi:hypothetical protein E4U43_001550, partial [Claviceps pusilla]
TADFGSQYGIKKFRDEAISAVPEQEQVLPIGSGHGLAQLLVESMVRAPISKPGAAMIPPEKAVTCQPVEAMGQQLKAS